MRSGLIFLTILFACIKTKAQTFADKQATLQKVFDNIVNAYGNAKAAPHVLLISANTKLIAAQYVSFPRPQVQVHAPLFDLCKNFGSDSLNALAIIISHELAHYYNDDQWTSDYAFVIRTTNLGKKLRQISFEEKVKNEAYADNQGLYYACIAGYKPFEVYSKLIDKIYSYYQLPNIMTGYPVKIERKIIAEKAKDHISKLYPVFEAGKTLTCIGKYQESIICFEYLTRFFPSRENYNNIGVARLLWALQLKPLSALEFIYPVETDPTSRLQAVQTRGEPDDSLLERMTKLLKDAKKEFEKAIQLDPGYTIAYVNLSAVYDLQGNFNGALGKLYELPIEKQQLPKVLEMEGIAHYHGDNEKTALSCFEKSATLGAKYNAALLSSTDTEKLSETRRTLPNLFTCKEDKNTIQKSLMVLQKIEQR